MKKILLSVISVCCLAGAPMHADAACGGNSVRFSGFKGPDDNEYIYALTSDFDKVNSGYPGANNFTTSGSVWECGSNSCAHGSGIIAPAGHAWDNHRQRGERFYWCNNVFGDSWQEYDLIPCDDSFYESLAKNPSLENLNIDMNGTSDEMIYRIDSNRGKTTVFCYTNPERVACVTTDGAQWFNGECQCLELNGVAREWNGTTCVAKPNATGISDGNNTAGQDNAQDTRESDCTSTGGTWTGSECTCDQGKNITQSTNGKSCVCISSDYEPDGVNGCKKTAAAIAADQQRQQDADNRSRKEVCEKSGGVWTGSECTCDASKNLRVQNNVCVCLDDENYKRSGDRCVLTDAAALRQKCESATGAYWDGVSCKCYEPNYSFNGTVCREDPAITECKSINGARWANGACVCNQSGYVPNYQTKQCEKSAATLQAEQAVAAQQKIDQASATLQSITDGLRVNKWRNEEGKFNTSRLLSDSIAGVVLGTAGGLITSSVVKKSQVSDGFEDMQCTVGGQVVAGWGDEFRVGIQ